MTGSMEMLVFPKVLALYSALLREGEAVAVTGRLSTREDEEPKLICEKVPSGGALHSGGGRRTLGCGQTHRAVPALLGDGGPQDGGGTGAAGSFSGQNAGLLSVPGQRQTAACSQKSLDRHLRAGAAPAAYCPGRGLRGLPPIAGFISVNHRNGGVPAESGTLPFFHSPAGLRHKQTGAVHIIGVADRLLFWNLGRESV